MDPFGGSFVLPANLEELRAEEGLFREQTEERLAREGVSWDWQHYNGDLVQTLLSASRLADVNILTRTMAAPKNAGALLLIPADVAFPARAPVMAVPPELKCFDSCGRELIAWNGSTEDVQPLS